MGAPTTRAASIAPSPACPPRWTTRGATPAAFRSMTRASPRRADAPHPPSSSRAGPATTSSPRSTTQAKRSSKRRAPFWPAKKGASPSRSPAGRWWRVPLQFGQPTGTKYLCAQIGGTSTSVTVPNIGGVPYLKDGYYYNVAVAATDAAGNVGPLSNVACGEPVPVADFWRLYYDAGGRAGGCSAEGVATPAGTSGLGVLMVASMVGIIRRRRRS